MHTAPSSYADARDLPFRNLGHRRYDLLKPTSKLRPQHARQLIQERRVWMLLRQLPFTSPRLRYIDVGEDQKRDAIALAFGRGSHVAANKSEIGERSKILKLWGDRRGLNPRHPGPQPGALPTELRP